MAEVRFALWNVWLCHAYSKYIFRFSLSKRYKRQQHKHFSLGYRGKRIFTLRKTGYKKNFVFIKLETACKGFARLSHFYCHFIVFVSRHTTWRHPMRGTVQCIMGNCKHNKKFLNHHYKSITTTPG